MIFNPRLHALSLLAAVLDRGRSLAEATDDNGLAEPADPRDRAFALHLTYGVLRWLSALEWLSSQLLRRDLKSRDRDIGRLILLGLFQLWQDESAAHAAVFESAECARLLRKPWAVPLINAVLRRFQRERADWLAALETQGARHAHPQWLIDALRRDWPEDWTAIVEANNQPAPLWLRARANAPRQALIDELEAAGFSVRTHAHAPNALSIFPACPVEAIPGFAQGNLSVQDPAAQLAAPLLDLGRGLRVLDACAAPGGKTAHILESGSEVSLTALDRSPQRLERVRENLGRVGLRDRPGLHLLAADASETAQWWDGEPYQRILLDAPCTATGVIRRHPEIKWLRTARQLRETVALQARLLDKLWPLLDTGGILLYATCSVLRDENDRQIKRFLVNHAEAEMTAIEACWGRSADPGRQILPGEDGMDGFYYARLRKV